ncbi:MAG: ATP-dependent zinc metalloprotease FtsH [Alphaproteobacteria bacterium]|nr:ATP-dependent zinc metalloprotease FtsH [Alphaproteobacteria bacterium]
MDKAPDKRNYQFDIGYFLIALVGILLLQQMLSVYQQTEVVPYSEFLNYLKDDKISEVEVGVDIIRAKLKRPMPDGRQQIVATRVDPSIAIELDAAKVKYSGIPNNDWLSSVLSWIIPITVMYFIWSYLSRRVSQGVGGLMAVSQSKAKLYVENDIKVTFDDVAGVDEAKDELREIVAFLKDPKKFGRLGAHIPKGILLVGPPGTGKTMLAKAVAGEAGVPFFSINGSEFVELFVGVGAARVRDLFSQARQNAPCIIFIDELDALGRARGISGISGGHDEKEQTLNQLLSELDGFDPSAGVILLAATNRPEVLDPALLRAGRFDRQIGVDRPDKDGRMAILNVHLKKVSLGQDIDPKTIAAMTPGFTGADVANLVNEAAMLATRRDAQSVSLEDFTAAIERIVAGPEKRKKILSKKEREIVAYHEMGHALVAMALPGTDLVKKVSIIPRGFGALGYTMQMPSEDRYLMGKSELMNRMAVLLGGRAAEILIFKEPTTGASDDLQRATEIARAMVTSYGMDADVGQASFAVEKTRYLDINDWQSDHAETSDKIHAEIDKAVVQLIAQSFKTATDILSRLSNEHQLYAKLLLEKETFGEEDLKTIRESVSRLSI